jgi:hypothetical protein
MLLPSLSSITTLLLATQCDALSLRSWTPWSSRHADCLTDAEALAIASRYLALYNSGAVTSPSVAPSSPLRSTYTPIPLLPIPSTPISSNPNLTHPQDPT